MSKKSKKSKDILDPKQIVFLQSYLDPNSETYANAYQSAIKAGYSKRYAANITFFKPDWLRENMGNNAMLLKAEENLVEALNLPIIGDAMGPFGPVIDPKTKKPYQKIYTKILGIKTDVSKFVARSLGNDKWSEKIKHSGKVSVEAITGTKIIKDK